MFIAIKNIFASWIFKLPRQPPIPRMGFLNRGFEALRYCLLLNRRRTKYVVGIPQSLQLRSIRLDGGSKQRLLQLKKSGTTYCRMPAQPRLNSVLPTGPTCSKGAAFKKPAKLDQEIREGGRSEFSWQGRTGSLKKQQALFRAHYLYYSER